MKHTKLQIRMNLKNLNHLFKKKTQPIVKHMKLQIRMNLKTRCVELRTRHTSSIFFPIFFLYIPDSLAQKCIYRVPNS